jgi:hypothetical protein
MVSLKLMRPLLTVVAAASLAAAVPRSLWAADTGGGSGVSAVGPRSPFAGPGISSPPPQGPPGAALGPLPPPPPPPTRAGTVDTEERYPLKPRGDGGFNYEAPQFSAVVAPDGTVAFHDRRLTYSASQATFTFDLSDEFARGFAHGTLHPNEKANFLAATFNRRTSMAARWYADQKRAARDDLPRRLDAIWADSRYRRRERRRVIFLLWAETSPSGTASHPETAIIETWVRKHLPQGSPDAYSQDELQAFARERPGERPFRPYLSPLEMRFPAP